MRTRPIIFAALLLTPFALYAADALQPAEKPNILIILVDDLGYGDPRCFTSESRIATPHIDQLAAQGG